jgi:hypothetical protein
MMAMLPRLGQRVPEDVSVVAICPDQRQPSADVGV